MFDTGTFDVVTFDAGIASSVTPDTHDGFDADLYRKLQKKLKRKPDLIGEETERAQKLRSTIKAVVREEAVPESVRKEAAEVLAKPAQAPLPDFGPLAADLLALDLKLQTAQRALLEFAAAEWDRQDEEDIEMLLEHL